MPRVMICEDSALQAIELMEAAEAAGHDVCGCFASGAEAIRAIVALAPDIAIIDLTLDDGFTGEKVALALAARGCSVIVISGLADISLPLSRVQHIRIEKPVDPILVRRLLESIGPLHEVRDRIVAQAEVAV